MPLEIKYFFGAIMSAMLALLAALLHWAVSLHLAIQLLFWFQLGDIISGILCSLVLKNTASHIAFKSITARKAMMWMVVAAMVGVGALFKAVSGVAAELSIGSFSMPLGAGAAFWYCIIEAISILENAGKCGALPAGLLELVRRYLPGARPPEPPPIDNPARRGSLHHKI